MSVSSTPPPPPDLPEEPGLFTSPPTERQPNTQAKRRGREHWPAWMQDLPYLRFRPEVPDIAAPLVAPDELDALLKDADPQAAARIRQDVKFLEYELLRLFRQRDHTAKKQQNRYRKYQLGYIMLAALATLIGSCQAIALSSSPESMPVWAFGETVVALVATFLATIGGREAPMPVWLTNRRRAEQLRREYFRFLANLPPYDGLEGYRRSMLLSRRAAEINRGEDPREPAT
jgi:hypothetical protein